MFTGLVETLGTVRRVAAACAGQDLTISVPFASEVVVGESVAVNGACLTVVERGAEDVRFQVGPETLRRTNLRELKEGERVNLERSLRVGDRLGGHLVQGHVDDCGRIALRERQRDWEVVWIACPRALSVQMAPKGSVAVDGVSLTLVDVRDDRFSVALIPHTLANTTLGFKDVGASVNLETDLLAKYVARLLGATGVTRASLERAGFIATEAAGEQ